MTTIELKKLLEKVEAANSRLAILRKVAKAMEQDGRWVRCGASGTEGFSFGLSPVGFHRLQMIISDEIADTEQRLGILMRKAGVSA